MKSTLIFSFLILCQWVSAQESNLYQEIDKIIRYDTELRYPIEKSFVVGVIVEDSTYIVNFGPEHIDSFDLFEIGGVTKVFTATLATKLHLEEMIDLTQTINSYLPAKYKNDLLDIYTLEDLLMHQIDFPKRPSDLAKSEFDMNNPYAFYSKEQLLEFYAQYAPPGKQLFAPPKVKYSHINYALIEIIIEAKMNMPLEDLFQFYLFQEWNLQHTSLSVPGDQLKLGYDRSNMIPDPWEFQSFAGSEGLVSCMHDLLEFARLSLMSEDPVFDAVQQLRPQSKISNRLAHTYGWYVLSSRKSGDLLTHSGTTERHKTYLHLKKESKTAVVILCQSNEGLGELGLLILRMINNNWNKT